MTRKRKINFSTVNLAAMEIFQDEIEELRTKGDSYLDAVIQYCKNNNNDIEDVMPVLSNGLIEKIRLEEEANGTLKKQNDELSLGALDNLWQARE